MLNLRVFSEAAWQRRGVCGAALELNSGDTGDCISLTGVPFGRKMSISMWAQVHDDAAEERGQVINCNGNRQAVLIEALHGKWVGRVWQFSHDPRSLTVTAPFTPAEWTHLVLVYDDSQAPLRQLILYVNGVPSYTTQSPTSIWVCN